MAFEDEFVKKKSNRGCVFESEFEILGLETEFFDEYTVSIVR